MSEESKTLENVLHPVIFFQQKSVRPVIFYLKKSVRPVIFFSRKSMRPVILFFKKSMRPVIFGDQKSLRPAAVLTGPVSDKFCSLPNILLPNISNTLHREATDCTLLQFTIYS